MNKKIILSIGAATLLVSALVASSPKCEMKKEKTSSCKQEKMMHDKGHSKGHGLVKMFMQLDLSDAQRVEIKSILKTSRENMKSPASAFTDKSFDKKVFISLVKQKRDAKIESNAQTIENIYAVLNASQKKSFKNMLDKKQSEKMKMMGCKK